MGRRRGRPAAAQRLIQDIHAANQESLHVREESLSVAMFLSSFIDRLDIVTT